MIRSRTIVSTGPVSTAMAWGNAFQSVRHTVSTDINGAERKNVCEVCPFFLGHWIWDPGHQNFEASVPKGHQNMNVFVGPCWYGGSLS